MTTSAYPALQELDQQLFWNVGLCLQLLPHSAPSDAVFRSAHQELASYAQAIHLAPCRYNGHATLLTLLDLEYIAWLGAFLRVRTNWLLPDLLLELAYSCAHEIRTFLSLWLARRWWHYLRVHGRSVRLPAPDSCATPSAG